MTSIKDFTNLIISVDDFGISKKANENILKLIKLGRIDRVSIMISNINESNKDDFLRLAKLGVKLDLHLVIKSITPTGEKRKLKEGVFKRGCLFLFKYFSGAVSIKKIEKEWREQVETFCQVFGKVPDGINSHQHTHFFPAYLKIILKLSQKYGIKYIRFGKKGFLNGNGLVSMENNAFIILKLLRELDKKFLRKGLYETSDYLASLDWIPDVKHFFRRLPKGTIEIVCHPERKEEFEIVHSLLEGATSIILSEKSIEKKEIVSQNV